MSREQTLTEFSILDGDVPHTNSFDVYISQTIRFARVSSHLVDFNDHNKRLTAKHLQQGIGITNVAIFSLNFNVAIFKKIPNIMPD